MTRGQDNRLPTCDTECQNILTTATFPKQTLRNITPFVRSMGLELNNQSCIGIKLKIEIFLNTSIVLRICVKHGCTKFLSDWDTFR